MSGRTSVAEWNAAIDRLAEVLEGGHLLASMGGMAFLDGATEQMRELREKLAKAEEIAGWCIDECRHALTRANNPNKGDRETYFDLGRGRALETVGHKLGAALGKPGEVEQDTEDGGDRVTAT